jgi:outer membrane receptor protein involved in Fe transport
MGTQQESVMGTQWEGMSLKHRFFSLLVSLFLFSLAPVTALAADDQAQDTGADAAAGVDTGDSEGPIEEVTVVGSQIKGAAISDALSVSVIDAIDIEAMGIGSGDELLDYMPEMGQNTFNEAEVHSGGVNAVRGDVGAFNLRNMGTGNTLVLLNGRRMVNAAGYQTEEIGGAFVPVNTVNSNAMPVFGVQRVEVLRDGASAIYGADAVAGVVNTVLKKDVEGLTVRVRYDDYDNVSRNDHRVNLEWGKFFNNGRTNVGVFADYYHRDRVNAQEDPKWADENYGRFLEGTEWEGESGWQNYSGNSAFPQVDFRSSSLGRAMRDLGLADSSGEIVTYPTGDSRCVFAINDSVCGAPDTSGNYLYNKNTFRDVFSELDRYSIFLYVNHEFDNGVESFTELSWYEADSNLRVDASYLSIGASDLQLGPEYYFNPFGPCGSVNRLPESVIGTAIPCGGTRLEVDNFRALEAPRISDTDNRTYRFVQGFRGSLGEWDWETALVYSDAERNNVTHNRISNTLMQELLNSSSPDTYNIFAGEGGDLEGLRPALVDVYRKDTADLKMIDFKITNNELFNVPAGPVGFLAGVEYRDESFKDDRDPRLDGTIPYVAYEGATFPIVSDVANSSPTADNGGSRDVTSVFTEFAIPVMDNLDVQLALRYEDFSDVGSTTVGKAAFGWRPIDPLLFRGSWSEAFRAPNLVTTNEDLVVRNNTRDDAVCWYVADTLGLSNSDLDADCDPSVQRRASGSKDLEPEESTNTSFGVVWDATDNLTFTLDYWSIEKENSIGLFGENNHAVYDLLLRLRAGTANCDGAVFNPAVGRDPADSDDIPLYLEAGICPAGEYDFTEDTYTNLDTREIKGHDIGIYYDKDTSFGMFNFKFVGTFYDDYTQDGTRGIAKEVDDALKSGELPSTISLRGYGDLLLREGNMDEKFNASVRWSKENWGASLSMFKVGSFFDADQTRETESGEVVNWWLSSMTTYNTSVDYDFDAWGSDTRVRLGINNLTDERAPLCDCRFGYWSDAHRDMGRYWFVDLRMRFD